MFFNMAGEVAYRQEYAVGMMVGVTAGSGNAFIRLWPAQGNLAIGWGQCIHCPATGIIEAL